MLSVFRLIFKHFKISSNPFHVANTYQNEKKIEPLCLDCHGLQENAFQVNQLYNVTWSSVQAFLDFRGFDFRGFRFTAVYNSILFSSPLVLLSNLDLCVFGSAFFLCPHINSVNRGMPVLSQ